MVIGHYSLRLTTLTRHNTIGPSFTIVFFVVIIIIIIIAYGTTIIYYIVI